MDDDQSVLGAVVIVALRTTQQEPQLSVAVAHGREVLGRNRLGDFDRRSRGRGLMICDGPFLRR